MKEIRIESGSVATFRELENAINAAEEYDVVKLTGDFVFTLSREGTGFTVGKNVCKDLITVNRQNIILDGSCARIRVTAAEKITEDHNIFRIAPAAQNVEFRDVHIEFCYEGEATSSRVCAISNNAFAFRLDRCRIDMTAACHIGMTAIYNNGNLETTLETRADNFVAERCNIRVTDRAGQHGTECTVYGIYSNLANSVLVENCYIYSTVAGAGERQRAVGVYLSGRYARLSNNNIKANGCHNKGRSLDEAHTYGVINDAHYSLISMNNIVGEWGGQCVGVLSTGTYLKLDGNKILATHTIKGRSVKSYGDNAVIVNNVITSTSRNPRLLECGGRCNIIANNCIHGIMPFEEYRSGCVIYFTDCHDTVVTGNQLLGGRNCGIFGMNSDIEESNNSILGFREADDFKRVAGEGDTEIMEKLSENRIQSIEE